MIFFNLLCQYLLFRCEILGKTKEQQKDELARMIDDHESSEMAQRLAEKISTVAENMQILTDRLVYHFKNLFIQKISIIIYGTKLLQLLLEIIFQLT